MTKFRLATSAGLRDEACADYEEGGDVGGLWELEGSGMVLYDYS
jgi:hypothetical protein